MIGRANARGGAFSMSTVKSSHSAAIAAIIALALAGVVLPAAASPKIELEMRSAVQVVSTDAHGKQVVSYAAAATANPGSRVLYTIDYRNAGDQPANAVSLVGEIPANAAFVEVVDSAAGVEIRYSSDGGRKFAFLPFSIETTTADGKTVKQEANAGNFTHVRFTFTTAVAPGASGHVSYLVQID
jgi:uncharacterized repeat protein (TIGR01451 family)